MRICILLMLIGGSMLTVGLIGEWLQRPDLEETRMRVFHYNAIYECKMCGEEIKIPVEQQGGTRIDHTHQCNTNEWGCAYIIGFESIPEEQKPRIIPYVQEEVKP